MIAVIVVNYGRPADTVACLRSLECARNGDFDVFLFDNGVHSGATAPALAGYLEERTRPWLTYRSDPENLGFAGACNLLISELVDGKRYRAIALVNNDAVVDRNWLCEMAAKLDLDAGVQMVAARMMRFDRRDEVDSLGIVLYRSGLAANRTNLQDPLLGPCGGAALYGAELLARVREASGHVFDPAYFCYSEDTDLAIRARLLGFTAAYADAAIVWHKGSATSGGAGSNFVMYHGLRNSLHTMHRDLPAGFFLRFWPWMLVAQVAIVVKYLRHGRASLLRSVYRGWFAARRDNVEARRRLKGRGVMRWASLSSVVAPRLYDAKYLRLQLKNLFGKGQK